MGDFSESDYDKNKLLHNVQEIEKITKSKFNENIVRILTSKFSDLEIKDKHLYLSIKMYFNSCNIM